MLKAASTQAQSFTSDEYFQKARQTAFEQKKYAEAIQLCQQALKQSPDYLDIRIFLGRLYYWNNQKDSSLSELQAAFQKKPDYEDAAQALADITYFEEDYTKALNYSQIGLQYHPSSSGLAIRKAKCLAALLRHQEAYTYTDSLLRADPDNDQLRSLTSQLREYSNHNKVGVGYDYTYFDKQFTNPWHLINLDYSRQTKAGSFGGRVNYTNRFAQSGLQFEAEGYPRISKVFYAYANVGYSADMPLFPKWRAGFSLYANLPKAFEAESGFRYLNFDNNTWIYTISLGKYYKNFWFNARTYLSPGNNSISQSYTLTTRYYLKGADDYFSFFLGRGISPDDRLQATRLNSNYRLQTARIGGGYRFSLNKQHIFYLTVTYENVEYLPETKGNQLNFSVGYLLRF
ncbi:YaiO family outer membrane beta-barrel protein [Adhaeribacter pallidiroseus]|uniref:YaiO family outer membrane beta-barrel protein n=1 Tax=Adhaeribacter pallidiroseus TaxID=2072847 RepID=UPI001314D17F|nr:YaiO family outer membrane beta-barrel protein [Adhaeribacter pallidiroseus]